MPPTFLLDLSAIDLDARVASREDIEAVNPQRGQMQHLDGIIWIDDAKSAVVGYKDVTDDEFWVPGHIPGRPLLPGVIMIEAAAQLAAWTMKQRRPELEFVGFVGCSDVKFRQQVTPGNRLYLIGKEHQFKARRFICNCQGLVDGELVFEAQITGMPI